MSQLRMHERHPGRIDADRGELKFESLAAESQNVFFGCFGLQQGVIN